MGDGKKLDFLFLTYSSSYPWTFQLYEIVDSFYYLSQFTSDFSYLPPK